MHSLKAIAMHFRPHNKICKENYTVMAFHIFIFLSVVYHMRETGWVKVSSTDVAELHYQYKDEAMTLQPADQ